MTTARGTQHLRRIIRDQSRPLSPIPTERAMVPSPLYGVEVVAFDIYGTLLVSGAGEISVAGESTNPMHEFSHWVGKRDIDDFIRRALREAIDASHASSRERGIDVPEVDIVEVWRHVLALLELPRPLDAQEAALRYELATNPVWPMPDAGQTIEELRALGVRLGIVSNAQFYTPLVLETLLGAALVDLGFEKSVWSYEEGRAKPSPHLFSRLLELLSISDPLKVVYIGNDMLNDIEGAARAGLQTVLFAGDQRSLRERTGDSRVSVNPDAVITTLSDLPGLIHKDHL